MRTLDGKIIDSFTTALGVFVIAAVYMVTVHFWSKVPWKEAWTRTGLVVGKSRWWLISVALLPVFLGYAWLTYRLAPVTANDTSSAYFPLLGKGLTPRAVAAALSYGVVSAGFGEELLFRGLIAGALGRRLKLATANLIQALIFLAPHMLLLFVMPLKTAPLLVGVLAMGSINGWLRLKLGSIGPGMLLHGVGNTFVGLLVAGSRS